MIAVDVCNPGRFHRLQTLSSVHGQSSPAGADRVLEIRPGECQTMSMARHKNARTTPAVRAEIAASSQTASVLAQRYGITEQTVYNWKKREVFGDRCHKNYHQQTVLMPAQKTLL